MLASLVKIGPSRLIISVLSSVLETVLQCCIHHSASFVCLLQMQTHVDIKKLSPPSFHNVSVVTEGLPSLPGESVV